MSFAAVQKHVVVLEKAGLLTKRGSGRERLARGDVAAVRSVTSMLTRLEQVWRDRVVRIADLDFNPNPGLPVCTNVYTFAERDGGTRAIFVSTYESAAVLQQVLNMGVVEGTSSAINQIDDLVAR